MSPLRGLPPGRNPARPPRFDPASRPPRTRFRAERRAAHRGFPGARPARPEKGGLRLQISSVYPLTGPGSAYTSAPSNLVPRWRNW